MRHFQIENPIICEVSGPDAQRYLNSRLTQNMKILTVGQATVGAALTPQGKSQALLQILRISEQGYIIVSDKGKPADIVAAFRKYLVADRVVVKEVSDTFKIIHVVPEEAPAPPSGMPFSIHRGFVGGSDFIVADEEVAAFIGFLKENNSREVAAEEATYNRILARIPSYPEEINDETLFSEARYTAALSSNKGCFVGQEVVEKIESVGKTSYVLQIAEFEKVITINAGDNVCSHDGAIIGKVLSSASNAQLNRTVSFVRIKNNRSFADTSVSIGINQGMLRWES